MSTATATPRARPLDQPRGSRLQVVSERAAKAGRAPFVVLVATVLTTGLIALLMLHTLAAQDAFRLHDLQRRTAALSDEQQRLAVALQHEQDPALLARRARRLGMVPAESLAFIRLRDGRIVGVAGTATPLTPSATPAPSPSVRVSASPSAATTPATAPAATPRDRRAGHRSG